MAKVIRAFRERYHGMKLYNVGDDYPEDDKARVKYLVRQEFLVLETKPRRKKGADINGDPDA